MKRIIFLTLSFFVSLFLCIHLFAAENLATLTDKFYGGISDIMEKNMNNPDKCVREIDKYYGDNNTTILKIRKLTEENIKKAVEFAKNFKDAPIENYEKAKSKAGDFYNENMGPTAGITRYSNAMQEFAMKHPQQAIKIATMGAKLVPNANFE